MADATAAKWVRPKARQGAIWRAKERANAARWNLEAAIFLFAVLAIVLLLSFEGSDIWVTASVAIFGLAGGLEKIEAGVRPVP